MKLVKYFLLSIPFCTEVVLSSLGQGQPFSVTLQPPTTAVKGGAEVRVKAKTTNTSDHEIHFAKGFGDEEFEIEVRDAQGKTPPLTESHQDLKEHPTPREAASPAMCLNQANRLKRGWW